MKHLSHVIDEVEGKSKGSNTLVEGAHLNKIKSITSGSAENFDWQRSSRCAHYPIAKLYLPNIAGFLNKKV